ncbi:general negative regulator of transcription subunit 5 [Coemansia guatemalensis]|uniref:General negative regulator of transcription subunit n=1 Tax=Coemansia guatemalensis TaxID=2761395 RepID=A0A9W8I5J9_9FUNG|nr:general negative regulator of transcription subunit 5 [Coemansia guatemalensis]
MSRKLQSEIERVFKKVAEGIEDFEECYDKVLNASNASQKEKYETDLKKEIKKLQRLRDQIKTWIQSNDIKDKHDLLHHRKLIEKQMEKFKAIEKEMKTKAYSKEGLMQSTKLDPKEKEKLDLCNWLVDSVDSLSTQIDVLEATAETIQGSIGKKRRDPNKLERVSQLNERVERHKHHIRCLERIQRLVQNDSLPPEQVLRIQEDVNHYVKNNEDDEFIEDEFIYDELPLDDDALFAIPGEDDAFHNEGSSESEDEEAAAKVPQHAPTEPEPPKAGRTVLGAKDGGAAKHSGGSLSAPMENIAPASAPAVAAVTTTASSGPSIAMMPQPSTLPPAPVESKNAWADVKESVLSPSRPATTTGIAQSQAAPPSASLAQPWAAVASQHSPVTANASIPSVNGAKSTPKQAHGTPTKPLAVSSYSTPDTLATDNAHPSRTPAKEQAYGAADGGEASALQNLSTSPTQITTSPVGTKRSASEEQSRPSMQRPKDFTLFQDNDVPDAFADLMATFMKAKQQFSAKKAGVYSAQSQMVDLSLQGIPSLLDQERPKTRGSRAQVATPSYYPQTALPVMEHPGMASRLDLDTLFFAFYYQPNTYQQYLAAKELNRQSWRFHKKYLTWFQRYEEPSDITDDYEQGTYLYFDYEGAWCQRKKSEFRFEYQFLEDSDL